LGSVLLYQDASKQRPCYLFPSPFPSTGWYTEKYRRDEDDIDGNIKKLYVSDIREAHEKLPQMTATIRGQDVQRLDRQMNKMVWGGKAQLDEVSSGSTFGGGFGGTAKSSVHRDDAAAAADDDDKEDISKRRPIPIKPRSDSIGEDDPTNKLKKEKRRRKRKGKTLSNEDQLLKEEQERLAAAAERKKLVVQSTVAGVAVGAVAVAAVTVFMGGIGGAGSSSGRR
jgi:hypothetical protein